MTARSGGIDSGGIAHNEAETAFFDVVFIDGSVACAADLPSAVER